MARELRLYPEVVLTGADLAEQRNAGVVVAGGQITEIADAPGLRARPGDAEVIELPGQVLMPGFVNAHQHGRGLTQFQLGYADGTLETWLPSLRGAGVLDPYLHTRLATFDMIAAGVTGTIQANTAYGTGDLGAEMRATFRAYADSGMRAAVGVGYWDRCGLAYPPDQEAALRARLPSDLLERLSRRPPAFCSDATSGRTLMQNLRAEHETALVRAAYAPSGPQWVSDALMAAVPRDAAEAGAVVHMHVAESFTQHIAMRDLYPDGLIAHLERLGPVDARLSFGHAVWLGASDADRAAARGVTLVRNAGSNLRLHAGIAPLAEYRRRGVAIAIGTDSFSLAENEDILAEMRLAGRLARSPQWDGPPAPTPRDMLSMLTRCGAAAAGFGAASGAIAEGAPADLVALDLKTARGSHTAASNAVADLVYYRASQHDVRMTMVAGDILFRDGRHLRGDRDRVIAAAAEDTIRAAAAVAPQLHVDIVMLVEALREHYAAYVHAATTRPAPWVALASASPW